MTRSEERERRERKRRFAGDYYYNAGAPAWTERDEAWYRHTYGLPASGRMGQRRHDIAEWGNPSFTQNNTNREYKRINEQHGDFERDRDERSYPDNNNSYDQRTWNRHGDESYNWGENANQHAVHRGKGPKGYIRTDERIQDDIHARLTDDAYVDASSIEVSVEKGEVTLTGTVPDRSSKRRAEDISELVSGVINVENRLRVK